MTTPAFKKGDRVQKKAGYRYPGIVVGVFHTTAGLIRYDVEADHPDFAGMIHIFNEDQLQLRDTNA